MLLVRLLTVDAQFRKLQGRGRRRGRRGNVGRLRKQENRTEQEVDCLAYTPFNCPTRFGCIYRFPDGCVKNVSSPTPAAAGNSDFKPPEASYGGWTPVTTATPSTTTFGGFWGASADEGDCFWDGDCDDFHECKGGRCQAQKPTTQKPSPSFKPPTASSGGWIPVTKPPPSGGCVTPCPSGLTCVNGACKFVWR